MFYPQYSKVPFLLYPYQCYFDNKAILIGVRWKETPLNTIAFIQAAKEMEDFKITYL